MAEVQIIWTDYTVYRCRLRGFDLAEVESVIRHSMNKTNMVYFGVDDVLHLAISDEPEAGSVEISPGITAEINAKGELIGIEILRASLFVRDTVIDSVQAKLMGLAADGTTSLTSPVHPKRARAGITGPRGLTDKVAEPSEAYLKKTPAKSIPIRTLYPEAPHLKPEGVRP